MNYSLAVAKHAITIVQNGVTCNILSGEQIKVYGTLIAYKNVFLDFNKYADNFTFINTNPTSGKGLRIKTKFDIKLNRGTESMTIAKNTELLVFSDLVKVGTFVLDLSKFTNVIEILGYEDTTEVININLDPVIKVKPNYRALSANGKLLVNNGTISCEESIVKSNGVNEISITPLSDTYDNVIGFENLETFNNADNIVTKLAVCITKIFGDPKLQIDEYTFRLSIRPSTGAPIVLDIIEQVSGKLSVKTKDFHELLPVYEFANDKTYQFVLDLNELVTVTDTDFTINETFSVFLESFYPISDFESDFIVTFDNEYVPE